MEEILLEKISEAIYEATRKEAKWNERPIIPEKWDLRDIEFKKQFIKIVKKYLEELPTPKEAHESWVRSYLEMGWKYGEIRDSVLKTHPDLVPFEELPKEERDKDGIFLSFVWLVKRMFDIMREQKRVGNLLEKDIKDKLTLSENKNECILEYEINLEDNKTTMRKAYAISLYEVLDKLYYDGETTDYKIRKGVEEIQKLNDKYFV